MNAATPLRQLLDRIQADKIAPIGIDDYVQVDTLLARYPELAQSDAREQIRYALASLLATDPDQWKKIWELSSEFLGSDQADRPLKPSAAHDTTIGRPAWLLLALRIVRATADIPRRRLLGAAAVLLIAGLLGAALWTVGTFHETSGPRVVQQAPPSAKAVASQWRKTPLPQDERHIDISVQQPARHLDARDIDIFVIGTILLIIGGYWFVLPWHIHRRRINEAKQNIEEGLKRRREMSSNANRNNVSRRLAYHVVRVPPMREEVASDTATVLGRLFGRIEGTTLDLDRTIDATIAAGGRFVLVRKEHRVARTITVLVDIEGGSHPWLHDIDWLLDRWRALGVQFQRYDFSGDPHILLDAATRLPTRLEKLARRAEGEPLVIISRKLTSQQFRS
ncbi:MAG TPA: hypothetical protein VN838_04675, partial [Bradyrhizobium sp.]|nr:hypothetical protein [Bradyrhizobium sp.]